MNSNELQDGEIIRPKAVWLRCLFSLCAIYAAITMAVESCGQWAHRYE